jgi:hypothetical protein
MLDAIVPCLSTAYNIDGTVRSFAKNGFRKEKNLLISKMMNWMQFDDRF